MAAEWDDAAVERAARIIDPEAWETREARLALSSEYRLTPADVLDLRASIRWRLSDQANGVPEHTPYICYAREDPMAQNAPGYDPEAWVLHVDGHRMAISPRIEVLAACLRCEWAEPGFVRRILDTATDPETALLNPDERVRLASRQRFEEKLQRERAADLARIKPAKPPTIRDDPSSTSLEDIL